jgi:hypothetical protein
VQALTHHDRQLAGMARGGRAAVVVPLLFALGLFVIKQPRMAGFSVFGTFAHLVMVNYARTKTTRAAQAATLTILGAILIALGTLASTNTWLAVAGAFIIGFLMEWPGVARCQMAVTRTALLLSFMVAVAVPTPLRAMRPQLEGWLLAGLMAQPILQLLWIRIRAEGPIEEQAAPGDTDKGNISWLPNAACIGLAAAAAILVSRLLKLEHAFWVVLGVLPVLTIRAGSPVRTFWREQAGTLFGFLFGVSLVAAMGEHQAWYWITLPFIIFAATYASNALGLTLSQAGFTVFVVVLFCIMAPSQRRVGMLRVQDVAIGGALSLFVASLLRCGEIFAEVL